MKAYLFFTTVALIGFSSCTKDGDQNLTNGTLSDQEKAWVISAANTFTYKNAQNDTDLATVTMPTYGATPSVIQGSVNPSNQFAEQTWHFPLSGDLKMHLDHYNGDASTKYVKLSLNNDTFRFNIQAPNFVTLTINTQVFANVLADSIPSLTAPNAIWKIFYGRNEGILRMEKRNGDVWVRQQH